jgi:4-carboxymuconolactone decarboxylase
MSIRITVLLLLVAFPIAVFAQSSLPPGIHPVTLSRLPPVSPEDLDEESRKILAERPDFVARPGPTHISIYNPNESNLDIPTGQGSAVGPRLYELAVIIVARELDQGYIWSSHAGTRGRGLEQSVIDIVAHKRDVTGLDERDATLITFGRTLLRENRVSNELWERMVDLFGRQQTVQLLQIMGAYLRAGFMLNAVNQQIPPEREVRLPVLD